MHSYYALTSVWVGGCMCPSYRRRRDRVNLGLWRSLYKGQGGTCMDIYMFGYVCKDGMKTLHSKEWTQLQLFDVATCLLQAGMPLLLGGVTLLEYSTIFHLL